MTSRRHPQDELRDAYRAPGFTPSRVRDLPCGDLRLYLECDLRRVDCRRCGGVQREHLDWHAVTEMDKRYLREQLAHADVLRLAVMDMWKPFRNVTEVHAPRAAILYDTFQVLRHLHDAMDQVRKAEYKRLTNRPDRTYIKGQKCVLLSHREHLSPDKRRALQALLAANQRLNTAYVRKEQFGPLWDDRREPWARTFFDQWTASLRWQRVKPFETCAAMIERHWDGIAAYCRPENQIALGCVEGLNNKIRVIQRRCYGLRDEDDLHLKILTCTLPPLPRTYIARKSPTRIPEEPLMFGAAVGMFAF